MNTKSVVVVIALIFVFSGCTPKRGLYHWGDYSETLYNWKNDATEESTSKHIAELQSLIEESEEKGLRVPPGIYCEYGYWHYSSGDEELGLRFFQKEAEQYPEAQAFIDFLLGQIEKSKTEVISND